MIGVVKLVLYFTHLIADDVADFSPEIGVRSTDLWHSLAICLVKKSATIH